MPSKRLALCALLVFLSVSLAAAQTTRPRRAANTKPPATVSPSNNATPGNQDTPPAAPRKRRPDLRQPPVLKERPRDKALWADTDFGGTVPANRPAAATAAKPAPLVKPTALVRPVAPPPTPAAFASRLQSAIETRLGEPYHFGATGDGGFDCSGLVWSVFQEAGVNFPRGAARHYWSQFEAPPPGEEYQFGALVFFNRLSHVGIVAADGAGFYHASSSRGVMYSPFDKYWTPRIVGFRRVPLN
jgi:cell wall-associated NlpC family hydrolase